MTCFSNHNIDVPLTRPRAIGIVSWDKKWNLITRPSSTKTSIKRKKKKIKFISDSKKSSKRVSEKNGKILCNTQSSKFTEVLTIINRKHLVQYPHWPIWILLSLYHPPSPLLHLSQYCWRKSSNLTESGFGYFSCHIKTASGVLLLLWRHRTKQSWFEDVPFDDQYNFEENYTLLASH